MTDTQPSIRELWNFRDLSTTEARFREWIEKIQPNDPFHYELQTQLARTFSLRSDFDQAHSILDTVGPHTDRAPSVKVRYLLERGRTFNSAGQKDDAMRLFMEASEVGKAAQLDELTVDAMHMVAAAASDTATQVKWNEDAIAYAHQSEDEKAKRWLGSLYNNLGWTYHDAEQYDNALTQFKNALAWHKEHGNTYTTHIAYYAVARALRSLERYQEALDLIAPVCAEQDAADNSDGFVHEEVAENMLAIGKSKDAKPHFAKAYALLKDMSWLTSERIERLKRLWGG